MLTSEQKKLVEENLGLAGFWAGKLSGKRKGMQDWDDVFQVACIALMHAAERYRPEAGVFAAYARRVVLHYMVRYFRRERRNYAKARVVTDLPEELGYGHGAGVFHVLAADPTNPEEQYATAEAGHRIASALATASCARDLMRDDPKPRGQGELLVQEREARRVYVAAFGEEPAGRRQARQDGATRSRRWYANLTPEQKERRLAQARARYAARKSRGAA